MGIVKSYTVEHCLRRNIAAFIVKWHYSKNVNGIISDYCFRLNDENGKMIGAMIYGRIAMKDVWKKYVEKENYLIELRRLCCIDETPKNTESYFIGHTLRWLKRYTKIKKVISYADATYNHKGIIYQASNFTLLGQTVAGKVINYNGRLYHDKTVRTTYNGKLKPFAKEIKEALDVGNAEYINTKGKYIYIYDLNHN